MATFSKTRRVGVAAVSSTLLLLALAPAANAAPRVMDSDHDKMSNSYEVANGLNPHKNDAKLDKDLDGLSNLSEFKLKTRANVADTDADGFDDADEIRAKLNPHVKDTNHNGRLDGDEDTDRDKVANEDEDDALESCAGDDADSDKDGVDNEDENELHTNPTVSDSDHDGMLDGEEDFNKDDTTNEDEDDSSADKCVVDHDHDGIHDEDEGDVYGVVTSFDEATLKLVVKRSGTSQTFVLDAHTRVIVRVHDNHGHGSHRLPESVGEDKPGGHGGGDTPVVLPPVPGDNKPPVGGEDEGTHGKDPKASFADVAAGMQVSEVKVDKKRHVVERIELYME